VLDLDLQSVRGFTHRRAACRRVMLADRKTRVYSVASVWVPEFGRGRSARKFGAPQKIAGAQWKSRCDKSFH
jgi:hypothetical protein